MHGKDRTRSASGRHVPFGPTGRSQRMIASLLVPIAPSISSVFWTAFLSLLIAAFISFLKTSAMVSCPLPFD